MSSEHRPTRAKRDTRRTLLSRRDAMTAAERVAATEQITEAVGARLAGRPAATIALYAAKGSEVATESLDRQLREAGWRVAYPRVVEGERALAMHETTIAELAVGRFGLREPSSDAPQIALEDVAVFVVPGLAFDRQGGRVGWGHGYYDATLARAPGALRIGLAFECQLVDAVPAEPHDARMHVVITERAAIEIGR